MNPEPETESNADERLIRLPERPHPPPPVKRVLRFKFGVYTERVCRAVEGKGNDAMHVGALAALAGTGRIRECLCPFLPQTHASRNPTSISLQSPKPAEGFFFKGLAKRFFLKVWPNLRLSLSDYPQGLLLQQAFGEGPSAGSSFAASYWERTIRRVFFCSKLLGKVHS